MANYTNPSVLDLALTRIATANRLMVCAGFPTSYANLTDRKLAEKTLIPGSGNGVFTIQDRTAGGREIVVAAQSGLSVTASGTADHVVLVNTSTQTILLARTCANAVLTSGMQVSVPSFTHAFTD